jgi:hypothetical protein
MMNKSIFPEFSLDRNEIHWEDYLYELTPVEQVNGIWFKRDDYFAPLGYGFINGSKVRQGIYLFDMFVKSGKIISSMSVHSPQHSFQAVVAKHFGVESYHIIGATKPKTAIKHENISIAAWFGAKFRIIGIAYNPALQRAVKNAVETEEQFKEAYALEYAISLNHKTNRPADVEKFHWCGSYQTQNIPNHIENIVIPAGSCNSSTSVLYGISTKIHNHELPNLKNVYLIGIGPTKIDLIEERLEIISKEYCNYNIKDLFIRNYVDFPHKEAYYGNNLESFSKEVEPLFTLHYHDLHGRGLYSYSDVEPFHYHGIEMHSRYEGKMMKYVEDNLPHLMGDKTLFWIVGSEPRRENIDLRVKEQLGPYPEKLELF